MKKFAFLLALVAVFAMSMTAFAADPASDDVTAVALSGDCNLTAVPAGNVYFLSDAKSGDAVIDLKVTVAQPTSPDFPGTMKALKAGPATGTIEVVSDDGNDGVYGVVVTIPSIDLTNTNSRDMVLTVAVSNDTVSQDITATLTPVVVKVSTNVVEGKSGKFEIELDGVELGKSVDVKAVSTNVSADVDGGKIYLSNLAAKAGEVLSIDVTVSKDNVMKGGVKVIGFDGKDEKILSFGIVVEADANKALAEEVKELAAEEGITLGDYAPGEAVEVTDAVARGLIKDAISRDLKVSADVQMVSLVDVAVAEGGYTVVPSTDIVSKYYNVPAGMKLDFAKFFEVGSKTKMEWIYEGKSGDKNFKYDLVVINGVAPADYKKLDNAGGRIVGNTLFIWDGVSDDKAVDPIVSALSAAKGSSSSSSCDMGFGLAAVAGLAALALRKRSK